MCRRNSPFPQFALNAALSRVLPPVPGISGSDYTWVVYNCAAHVLLTIIPPQPGTPLFPEVRKRLGLTGANFGLVQSAADQGTSDVLAIPDALKQLTLDDLQFAQTHWGRTYLAYNQAFGDIFGVS